MKPRKATAKKRASGRTWLTGVRHVRIKTASPLLLIYEPLHAALKRLVALLGNNQTADVLGVSPSQTSRWLHGEPIGSDSARRVLDLDYVLSRALQVLHPHEAGAFLTFPQPYLNGARPIDVLVTRGVGPVIGALDQIDQGAFA